MSLHAYLLRVPVESFCLLQFQAPLFSPGQPGSQQAGKKALSV